MAWKLGEKADPRDDASGSGFAELFDDLEIALRSRELRQRPAFATVGTREPVVEIGEGGRTLFPVFSASGTGQLYPGLRHTWVSDCQPEVSCVTDGQEEPPHPKSYPGGDTNLVACE